METKTAFVYYNNIKAGILQKAAGYVFEYDPKYAATPGARPVSLTMPLSQGRFEAAQLFPFFDGLLPEGWLLNITCRALKIDAWDRFGLLLHVGGDTPGAVTVIPENEAEK